MEPDPREANPVLGVLVLLSIALFCSAVFGLLNSNVGIAALSLLGALASGAIGLSQTPKARWAREAGLLAVAWFVFGVLAAIVWPLTAHPREGRRISCFPKVKQLAVGILVYAADFDDRLPQANTWQGAIRPITKNEGLFHCPVATSPWSYAMNGSLSGAKGTTIKDPDQHVLLFEANAALPDASGGREWLAPRHPSGDTTLANIAFADGHAKRFTFAEAATLKW